MSSRAVNDSKTFGRYTQYIQAINLPKRIEAGSEYTSTKTPLIVLRRKVSVLKELFQYPFLHITKQVRVQFHWDGLHVLGVHMEEPNVFLFPFPKDEDIPHNFFLKLSCLPDCAPGQKSLYVSIEVLRESLLLKCFAWFARTISVLSLLLTIALPFLYFLSKTVRIYINNVIGFSGTETISIAAVIFFSIFILSSKLDEVFPTLISDKNVVPLFATDRGSKTIAQFSLIVTEPEEE